MPQLVSVCKDGEPSDLRQRQLALVSDDMQTMVVELEEPCSAAVLSAAGVWAPADTALTARRFGQRLQLLRDADELDVALSVDYDQLMGCLARMVPCVGCRRSCVSPSAGASSTAPCSVEKLFLDLAASGQPTMEPFVVNDCAVLTVSGSLLADQRRLYKILVSQQSSYRGLVDSLVKCKRNKRCNLHSLDHRTATYFRWEDIWDMLSEECREECCIVEAENLLEMLQVYLQRHRFCMECKNKLMRAYQCLTGEVDAATESGYNSTLFQGLRYCDAQKHLHVRQCVAYMDSLVERADVELSGGRERHAKTLEMGQTELLTCLGLFLRNRLNRLLTAVRALEASFQLLYCAASMTLYANFNSTLDDVQGFNESFDRLCAELQTSAVNPQSRQCQKAKKKKKTKSSPEARRAASKAAESSRSVSPCSDKLSSDAGYDSRETSAGASPVVGCASPPPASCNVDEPPRLFVAACVNSAVSPSARWRRLSAAARQADEASGMQAAIEWFRDNQPKVTRERAALRQRIREQFVAMQHRIAAK